LEGGVKCDRDVTKKRRLKFVLILAICALTFLSSLGLYLVSRFIWPEANGLSIGFRRLGTRYDVICGIHDGDNDLWYYENILPTGSLLNASRVTCSRTVVGFHITMYFPNGHDWYLAVGAPFWFLIPVGLLGIELSRRRLKQNIATGTCEVCGYDLRASKDRCPECGTPFTASAKSQPRPPI
jgi:hypothetical protein